MKIDPDAARAIKLVAPAKTPSRTFASLLSDSAQTSGRAAQGAPSRAYGFAELGMFGRRQGDQGRGPGQSHDAPTGAAKTLPALEEGAGPRAAAQAPPTYSHGDRSHRPSTDDQPARLLLTSRATLEGGSLQGAAPAAMRIVDEPPAPEQDRAGERCSPPASEDSAEVSLVLTERDGEVQLIVGARGSVEGEELLEAFDEVLTEQGLDLLELTLDGEQVAVAIQSRSRNDGDRPG